LAVVVVDFFVDSLKGVRDLEVAAPLGMLPYPFIPEGAGDVLREPTGLCCCFKVEIVLLKKSPSSLEEVWEEVVDMGLFRIGEDRMLLSRLVYNDWV
jgi:hypothetical protein